MDDMGRRREVEAGAAGLEREHEEWDVVVLLEPAHQLPALLDLRFAVQDETGAPEHGAQERREWCCRLAELSEDQRFLLPRRNHLCNVAQTRELDRQSTRLNS